MTKLRMRIEKAMGRSTFQIDVRVWTEVGSTSTSLAGYASRIDRIHRLSICRARSGVLHSIISAFICNLLCVLTVAKDFLGLLVVPVIVIAAAGAPIDRHRTATIVAATSIASTDMPPVMAVSAADE